VPGGLPGLPQHRDHHREVVLQIVGTTVAIPIRRERLHELAEDHQHCRSVHAAIDRDRAYLHCLVNYRGDLDHSIKRVLALHNAPGAWYVGSLPTCVHDHETPHRGIQALIDGNWLAHVDHSDPWRATHRVGAAYAARWDPGWFNRCCARRDQWAASRSARYRTRVSPSRCRSAFSSPPIGTRFCGARESLYATDA
jgi:hypothetical protein